MKKICIIAACLGLFGWVACPSAFADKANGPKAKFFAKYDTNHNGVIDEAEKEAIRKDYAANPNGELRRFDKNRDGKLDDEEIAAIKPPTGKKKGQNGGQGGKAGKTEPADQTGKAAADKPEKAPDKAEKTDAGKTGATDK